MVINELETKEFVFVFVCPRRCHGFTYWWYWTSNHVCTRVCMSAEAWVSNTDLVPIVITYIQYATLSISLCGLRTKKFSFRLMTQNCRNGLKLLLVVDTDGTLKSRRTTKRSIIWLLDCNHNRSHDRSQLGVG